MVFFSLFSLKIPLFKGFFRAVAVLFSYKRECHFEDQREWEGTAQSLFILHCCRGLGSGFSNDSAFYDSNTEEELRQLGFDPACMLPVTRDYSFTVDTQESRALIPLAR